MSGWTALDRLFDEAPVGYSACVQEARGRIVYAYAAGVARPAASLIKVPLAMALVESDDVRRRGGEGIDLRTTVALRELDRVEGEGSFDVAPAGTTRTLRELIAHALRESDNTASNLLIRALGMDRVNHFVRAAPYRLGVTRLRRYFMDFAAAAAGRDNLTTAREMCVLFGALLAPGTLYAPIVEWLKHALDDDKLVAGVPPGIAVAHKVGSLPGVEHDAGIVKDHSGHYVAALLAVELPDPETGKAALAQASRLIYGQMVGETTPGRWM